MIGVTRSGGAVDAVEFVLGGELADGGLIVAVAEVDEVAEVDFAAVAGVEVPSSGGCAEGVIAGGGLGGVGVVVGADDAVAGVVLVPLRA